MKKTLVLGALLLASLGACKQSDQEAAPAAPPQQPPAQAPAAAPATAPQPDAAEPQADAAPPSGSATPQAAPGRRSGTTGPTSAAATSRADRPPLMRAVRTGRQPGVDRLVFEFDTAGLPAWQAEYVDRPVRDCGSGDPIPVAGDAWLQIRFTGAQAHTDIGEATSGPRRRVLAQKNARELVRICDFEGEVTWVVGVAHPAPYKVSVLSKPSRLVLDIEN